MPILTGDIQLLASERLSDTFDGGGRMTGRVIVDGQSNNLFPDISELDRTYGRVSLRKCFVGVLTDSTDSYYGAHAIVADAPDDPRVAVTLFTTRSWVDQREAAKDRIERYLARGVRWPGQLLERQLTGQRAIALLLKAGEAFCEPSGYDLVISVGGPCGADASVRIGSVRHDLGDVRIILSKDHL